MVDARLLSAGEAARDAEIVGDVDAVEDGWGASGRLEGVLNGG
jgi:hypothetical protein